MQELQLRFQEIFVGYLPRLLLALGVLIAGWLVALAIAALVRAVLRRTTLDNRLAGWIKGRPEADSPGIEKLISRVVFWILMVFVAVAFFSILNLTLVTTPLSEFLEQIFAFLPRLLSAGLLLLLAWLLASGLRFAVTKALSATSLDRRLGEELESDPAAEPAAGAAAGEEQPPAPAAEPGRPARKVSLSKTLGDTVYWLVFLLFLPAILDALALEGLLGPVRQLLDRVMAFLPNLLGALLILGVGWLLARIIQRVVANLLAAAGVDSLGDRLGLNRVLGEKRLSRLLSLVVYILVLVPVVIAALDALALEAVTVPASQMLNRVLAAVPQLFAAGLLLAAAYLVARLVAELVTRLLAGLGFDRALARIGLDKEAPAAPEGESAPVAGGRTPSQLVGLVVLVGVMLFAGIEALRLLEFHALAGLVAEFTTFAGDVLLGVVIFAIGLFLAGLAADAIRSTGTANADLLATLARAAILVLAGAMALRQAGLAEDIVNLAFGLLLGAVAVAAAIAFGVGGRDLAARHLERWVGSLKGSPPGPRGPETSPGPGGGPPVR